MDEQEQRAFTFKVTQFIWLITGVVEGLIGLRVLLKMLGANPENPFAVLIYGVTRPMLWPFATLTAQPRVGNLILEFGSVIAMLVYGLLAWALVQGITILLYPLRRQPPQSHQNRPS